MFEVMGFVQVHPLFCDTLYSALRFCYCNAGPCDCILLFNKIQVLYLLKGRLNVEFLLVKSELETNMLKLNKPRETF